MGKNRIIVTRKKMIYHWNVIGHGHELQELERDFSNNNVYHAYLFVGPEKIGKYRIAKAMAQILQCPNNFCHTCPSCVQIEKKCHPDTIELEDDGESIKIGTIREIIARLNMTGQSKYKILLIQDCKRFVSEAASCILKTLEEPPEKTIFIFTTGQLRDVMPTIASRMRILNFKKLPDLVLRASLKESHSEADEETLDQILLLSLGRSGRAIQLLSQPEKFRELRDLYRQIQFLDEKASIATRLQTMQELSQDPAKVKTFLSLFTHYLRRKLFREKSFGEKEKLMSTLENIHQASDLLAGNVNGRLVLENIMLQL